MEQREGITMYRIFIVEDDEIISEVLKKTLSSWGYDVLTAKIQAILRRTYSFGTPGNVLEYKGVVLSPSRCILTWNGNDIDLTKNELRILEILMEHAGKVVSRDAIMTKLWESDSFIDDNTLTVNITRLRRKLEKEGLKEFIITKKGLGYMV